MPKSIVNPKYEVREDAWVVSVLNTDGVTAGLTGGGHAMIVLEGIVRPQDSLFIQPYFRQCDILASTTEDDNDGSLINTKGRIINVRIFPSPKPDYDYSAVPSQSYYVDPLHARAMISSIERDQAICKAAQEQKGEYPLYQRVGTNHMLSEVGLGENCASWCIRHLLVAGIDLTSSTSKPKKVAGKGCSIL